MPQTAVKAVEDSMVDKGSKMAYGYVENEPLERTVRTSRLQNLIVIASVVALKCQRRFTRFSQWIFEIHGVSRVRINTFL